MAAVKTCSTRECSASQARKSNKPLMEKRRRARINECLGELKQLLMDSLKKDGSGYSKLEKADILELTVKYLRNVQRQQVSAAAGADSNVMSKYRAGFNECAQEVARFVNTQSVDTRVRTQLIDHLAKNVRAVNQMSQQPQNTHCMQPIQIQIPSGSSANTTVPINTGLLQAAPVNMGASATILTPPSSANTTPEPTKVCGNFQIIPNNGSGNFAFIVPSQMLQNGQSPIFVTNGQTSTQAIPVYASVTPSSSPASSCSSQQSPPATANTFEFSQKFQTPLSPEVTTKSHSPVWRPW